MWHRSKPLRVVIDTNVILSSYITKGGTPWRALHLVLEKHTILLCSETLSELIAKFSAEKFARYGSEAERMEYVSAIEELAEFVAVTTKTTASRDPKDNIFLSLALDGKADYLVSGDTKHLHPLNPFEGIPILSPADFLARAGN